MCWCFVPSLQKTFDAIDSDHNGTITYQEFKDALKKAQWSGVAAGEILSIPCTRLLVRGCSLRSLFVAAGLKPQEIQQMLLLADFEHSGSLRECLSESESACLGLRWLL